MYRILGIIAFGLGGLCSSLILMTPNRGRLPAESFGGSQVSALYNSTAATATVGVVVAVLIAALLHHRALFAVVGVGLTTIAVLAVLGASALGTQYAAAIAGGLVLGGLAGLAGSPTQSGRRAPWPVTALATGAIIGFLFDHALRDARFSSVRPRRYADFLPPAPNSYLTGPSDWFIATAAVVALGAIVAVGISGTVRVPVRPVSRVALVGGCVLPVASLVTYWRFRESAFSTAGIGLDTWRFGYLLLAAALLLALLLPKRSGLLWVAIVATIAGNAGSSSIGADWVVVAIAVAMTVVGAMAGYVVHQPLWGILLLGVCTATALIGDPSDVAVLVALLFVVPGAAAYSVVAAIPSTATVTASTLGIPAVLTVSVGVQFGWTAYTPLTDSSSDFGIDIFTVSGTTTLTLSMISLAVCAAVTLLILRRPERTVSPDERI